jgi:hypothetical protein
MGKRSGMRIRFSGLVGWVLGAAVLLGGAGAWPTWKLGGEPALEAELTAAACVLVVMLASGAAVVRTARRGPGPAAYAFLVGGLVRAVASVVLAAAAWALRPVPPLTLMLWVAGFYGATLAGEVLWLTRALQKDALDAALGRLGRGGWTGGDEQA